MSAEERAVFVYQSTTAAADTVCMHVRMYLSSYLSRSRSISISTSTCLSTFIYSYRYVGCGPRRLCLPDLGLGGNPLGLT